MAGETGSFSFNSYSEFRTHIFDIVHRLFSVGDFIPNDKDDVIYELLSNWDEVTWTIFLRAKRNFDFDRMELFIAEGSVEISDTKFVKTIDNLTFGEKKRFWQIFASLNTHKFKQRIMNVQRLSEHEWTDLRLKKYISSFKANKQLFSKNQCQLFLQNVDIKFYAQSLVDVNFCLFPKSIQESVSSFFEELTDRFVNIPGCTWAVSIRQMLYQLVLTIYGCYTSSTRAQTVTHILSFLNVVGLLDKCIVNIAPILAKVFSGLAGARRNEFVAQGDISLSSAENEHLFVGVTKLLLHSFGVSTDTDITLNKTRLIKLEMLSKTLVSIDKITTYFKYLFEYARPIVLSKLTGKSVDDIMLGEFNKDIVSWMEQVSEAITKDQSIGLVGATRDREFAMHVRDLMNKGNEFLVSVQRSKLHPAAVGAFCQIHTQCKELFKATKVFYDNDKARPEPFVLYLFGGSGIGKSVATQFIMVDIYDALGKKFNRQIDVYVRNDTQDHWDGYCNQPIVIFDDYLQNTEKENQTESMMELIKMKNTMAYPLKMADLEAKGNTRFTSEFVMMTSNTDIKRSFGTVVSLEAFRRRRDVVAEFRVKPEFCLHGTSRLDQDKVDHYLRSKGLTCRFTRDIYQIQLRSRGGLSEGVELGEPIDYKTFIEYCVREWQSLNSKQDVFEREIETDRPFRAEGLFSIPEFFKRKSEVITEYTQEELKSYFMSYFSEEDSERYTTYMYGREPSSLCYSDYGIDGLAILDFNSAIDYFSDFLKHRTSKRQWWRKQIDVVKGGLEKIKIDSTMALAFGATFSSIMLVWGAWRLFSSFRNKEEEILSEASVSGDQRTARFVKKYVPEGQVSGDQRTQRFVKKYVPEGSVSKLPESLESFTLCQMSEEGYEFDAQGCTDPNAYSLILSLLRNSIARVTVVDLMGVRSTMNGLFVCGTVMLVPCHLLFACKNNGSLTFSTPTVDYSLHSFSLSDCVIRRYEDKDVALIQLPRTVQSFPDITQHFIEVDDFNKHELREGALLQIGRAEKRPEMIMQYLNTIRKNEHMMNYTYRTDIAVEKISLVRSLEYVCQTQNGDCGAPLVWFNKGNTRKISGFHVAGTSYKGLSTIVSQSFLKAELKHFSGVLKPLVPKVKPVLLDSEGDIINMEEFQAQVYGAVDPQYAFRNPDKTGVRESLLHGQLFTPVTKPAMLRCEGKINPLKNGVMKQFVPPIMFPQKVVDQCVADYGNEICSMDSRYKNKGLLSNSQILNGIAGDDWIRPMNMKTSPGFPYIHIRKGPGKSDFIEGEPGNYTMGPLVTRLVEKREDSLRKGIIEPTLFCDVMKDERRPIEKVNQGKTRVFNCAPFDLNILVRKYFGNFIAHLMDNCVTSECSVGLNPHSRDWGTFYRILKDMPGNWIAGDFSNYDKQLPYQLCLGSLDVINRFYKSDSAFIREGLFNTMFNAFHLCKDIVYRVPGGNPSGVALTVIINSMVNSLFSRLSFVLVADRVAPNYTISDFRDNVKVRNYGDDNLVKVSHQCNWYNMHSISSVLAEYGITYTSPTKGEITDDYLDIDDVQYLKRGFRCEGGNIFAPLDMNSIQEMINWTRESPDPQYAIQMNIEAAKHEMFHYGNDDYSSFCDKVDNCAAANSISLKHFPFCYFLNMWEKGVTECGIKRDDLVPEGCDQAGCGFEPAELPFM